MENLSPAERFRDNPNMLISDVSRTSLWLPKDSYGDLGKWINWQEALSYVRLINSVYAGGFSDWRLPNKEEALSLYDETLINEDWSGEAVHIHPVFMKKCGNWIWVSDVDTAEGKALRLNLRDGALDYVDKDSRENMAARLLRTEKK
jgi:hypothetical protein